MWVHEYRLFAYVGLNLTRQGSNGIFLQLEFIFPPLFCFLFLSFLSNNGEVTQILMHAG